MTNTIDEILRSLELQEISHRIIDDVNKKLSAKKYRQAFLILEKLKESGNWVLDKKGEEILEKFWWDYAN
jgi:transcriptional regulator of NAD metabolism